ncbi:bifunctional aconitate hydratase 2/2-methylisocitrate dehydratase [Geotalea uraniireducens]|uniref:Aconitate hydratase B n=1 Tax=Geotalea uraniireducens (strain Rf4) TaxID=351605 RepID=A5GFC4_GEOUR|nr:bifunctional aconitate hydratase 2/2-methylisocitrate dehydratase [Geotalea uraniireducens]ABQ26129.1 aconitase [Geotalea uraniireducens Rf4]
MIEAYLKQEAERQAMGIPAKPLDPEQTADLCKLLENPPAGKESFLLNLLKERVSPGVDPAAEVKAAFLAKIVNGAATSPLVSKKEAVQILGTMLGGYNVTPLVEALKDAALAEDAAKALSGITLVYDAFDEVLALSKTNASAKKVVESWANAEWFTSKPGVPATIKVKVYKVEGEINTDDFSPAGDAWSRPDIPLHSLAMGKTRFPDGLATIAKYRADGFQVAFAGDVVGTGSSRKSACNSVLWANGNDIPCVPNKRRGGVIIGGVIAPIFFNTAQDSGALPLKADVTKMNTGDVIIIDTVKGEIKSEGGELLSTFKINPNTLADEFQAGGRIPLIIGRALTDRARNALGMGATDVFTLPVNPVPKAGQGYSLAQKMVGKACGVEGILPGTACEPKMTTVGSQDTTGPMTADELKELACLKFLSPMFMQSFCHTAAYPKPADVKMHKTLPKFITERSGVPLKPGDGVIHSWLNRLLLPDTVGTGGDSHTRFPIGISFPAGSGLVAFAGALGFMPLDMPESVLVRFKGQLNPGITLRDVVNAIPYWAIKQGHLTVPKKNKVNIFNGRILEMEGLPELSVEQAFELTDAAAERSAAAGCIKLSEQSVATYLRSNVALMKKMIAEGYEDAKTLQNRIDAVNEWLKAPKLLEADANAEYAAVIEINLAEITEPILACPNDPDDVKLLSEVAGTPIQDVFLGSCMTNIGHFRAAAEIWRGQKFNPAVRTWICPPTRMDQAQLKDEALFSIYSAVGARIEIAGCSLCMGNQARVPDGVNMFSTSTRNFDDRIGNGAKVYLGSAEIGAVISNIGKLPTPAEYLAIYKEKIEPKKAEIYKYLQFDEMNGYK